MAICFTVEQVIDSVMNDSDESDIEYYDSDVSEF